MGQNLSQSCCGEDNRGQANQIPHTAATTLHLPAISGFDQEKEFGDIGDSQLPTIQHTRHWKGNSREQYGTQRQWWEDEPNAKVTPGNGNAHVGETKTPAPTWAPTKVEGSVEASTKTESDYPGYVDLNSCRLGDGIDALISVPIIILQIVWITMEDQESTEGNILYWTAAGMEIYLLIELWGYVLIGEVTPMSKLSLWLMRLVRRRFHTPFIPFPDIIRRISRFLLGLSLIANTVLSFWPGVNDLIPLALSIQLLLALLFSATLNQ